MPDLHGAIQVVCRLDRLHTTVLGKSCVVTNQAYRSKKIRLHQYICRLYLLAKTTTYNENNLHNFLTLMPAS
jgi:hypothetical protein